MMDAMLGIGIPLGNCSRPPLAPFWCGSIGSHCSRCSSASPAPRSASAPPSWSRASRNSRTSGLVERTFTRIAGERRLAELYNKWFLRRLPTGETLNLPMSAQLAEIFRMLGEPE